MKMKEKEAKRDIQTHKMYDVSLRGIMYIIQSGVNHPINYTKGWLLL